MANNLQVKAKVQVTLEVSLSSCWGSECAMDQVHKQASVEAVNAVSKLLAEPNTTGCRFCTIGQPKVIATTSERV